MVVASWRPTPINTLSSEALNSRCVRLLVPSKPKTFSLRHKITQSHDVKFSESMSR